MNEKKWSALITISEVNKMNEKSETLNKWSE